MSSKIISELVEASGIEVDADANYDIIMPKIADAISELPEDKWNALSDPAADYYNEVSTALNKKKPVPAPSDWEEPKVTRGRQRRNSSDGDAAWEPKVGAVVKLTNTRDQEFIGEIVEMDDDTIVLEVAGEEKEFARKRVKSVGPAKAPDAEVSKTPEPATIKVGAVVKVTNSRDVSFTGKVTEMDDDTIVLEVDGQEKEFVRKKLKACELAGGASKNDKPEATKADKASDAKPGRATKADNGGVSVTGRIRALICDDLELKVEDIAKQLTKEGLQFRDNTLALTFAETHKVIAALRDAGKLKK